MDFQDSSELDLLLSDVKRLLDEDVPYGAAAQPGAGAEALDATRKFTPVAPAAAPQPAAPVIRPPWEDPDFAGAYDAGGAAQPVIRSASVHVAPAAAAPAPARAPAAPRPQAPAQARRADPPQRRAPTRAQRAARQALAEDNEDDDYDDYDEPPRPKRRFRWIGRLLLVLLLLLGLAAGGLYLLADQPTAGSAALGLRRSGVSTILLIGTDAFGLRTDTLMLLSVDDSNHTASLVSIPRDTLVNGPYQVPKINSVYAVNNGGEEGMEMLLQRVTECIGFPPDGHVLVDLDAFVDLVDIMGGVTFDVPVNMRYSDPSQNLDINLTAGEQKLDGTAAMGLVRYRTGYAMADLDRVNVQRDFVSAAADQWLRPSLALKLPRLLAWVQDHVETDLSLRNLTWLAKALMRADKSAISTETLPGRAVDIMGGSYYMLDPYDVAALVNRCLSPYVREITVDDLLIRN